MTSRAISALDGDARAVLVEAMLRAAAGDQRAFADLFRRTSPRLFGLCLRIMSTRQEAEEVLQEAYLTIWRRAGSFDAARGSVIAWMTAVTRNCAIDRLRTGRSIAGEPIDLAHDVADAAPLASDTLLERERQQRLSECLGELAPSDIVLIRTAFLEGSTYSELATRAGRPLGTIKSRIRRALLQLRECL